MHLDVFELILFKLGMMIATIELNTMDTSLADLDLDSRSQGCEKAEVSVPITSQSFNQFGWNLIYC